MNGRAKSQPIVLVIDDNENLREAMSALFRSVGLQVKTFTSASEFMQFSCRIHPPALFST